MASPYPHAEGEVHIWLAHTRDLSDPCSGESAGEPEALLDAHDRDRLTRFRRDAPRAEFLAGRVLLRRCLSLYAPLEPGEWHFVHEPDGRPRVANPEASHLSFNLSHSRGRVGCAITRGAKLGFDLEDLEQPVRSSDLARRILSHAEHAHWSELSATERDRALLARWSLKEAYAKARGLGLKLPMSAMSFALGPCTEDEDNEDSAIRFALDERIDDAPERWRFFQTNLAPRHVLSLCAPATSSAPLIREVPFQRSSSGAYLGVPR